MTWSLRISFSFYLLIKHYTHTRKHSAASPSPPLLSPVAPIFSLKKNHSCRILLRMCDYRWCQRALWEPLMGKTQDKANSRSFFQEMGPLPWGSSPGCLSFCVFIWFLIKSIKTVSCLPAPPPQTTKHRITFERLEGGNDSPTESVELRKQCSVSCLPLLPVLRHSEHEVPLIKGLPALWASLEV